MRFCFSFIVMLFVFCGYVHAGEVMLKNGDRISGKVVEQSAEKVVVETDAMGQIVIKPEFIYMVNGKQLPKVKKQVAKVAQAPEKKDKPKKNWKGNWSVGGFQQGGNTRKRRLNYGLKLNLKRPTSEWTLESKSSYASESREMTEQKHYGMIRHGYQKREGSPWFFFGKLEADSDRFSNIDYRLVPSYGGGYWFSDTDDLKMLTDGALGYQYTAFRDDAKNEGEWVWIPRFYMDTKFIARMRLTQEVTLYPSLEDLESYRLRSETSVKQPITDTMSWKLTLAEDFNSNPRGSAKKNDYSLTAGIDVAF